MPDRASPPGTMWPSRAAEAYRLKWLGSYAVLRNVTGYQEQYAQARVQLIQALSTERIQSVFLVTEDRSVRPLPGLFWSLPEQDKAWHGDYLPWSDQPQTQFWQLEEYPFGPLGFGFAFVSEASFRAYFEEQSSKTSGGLPIPEDGETNQDYVLRALGLKEARKIKIAEARPLAKELLRARNQPLNEASIESLAESLTASMRALSK